MRKIDKIAGVPLCMALTVFDRLTKPFLKKPGKRQVRKILFIKPSEIGSLILAYPLMTALRAVYPEAVFHFLTFERNRQILNELRYIEDNHVMYIRDNSLIDFTRDLFQVMNRIRKEKFDIVFDLEFFSRFTALISYLSGAPKRIGFCRFEMEGLYRGGLLTHRVIYNPHMHVSIMYMAMLDKINDDEKCTPEINLDLSVEYELPLFDPTPVQNEEIFIKLRTLGVNENARLILINPGEGQIPLREWPLDNFIELCRKIIQQDDNNHVLIVGHTGCSEKADFICKTVNNERCRDISGKTSITELLTLFSQSHALIANDCGLAHLASLTNINQFILFGPETPEVFAPLGKDNLHIF